MIMVDTTLLINRRVKIPSFTGYVDYNFVKETSFGRDLSMKYRAKELMLIDLKKQIFEILSPLFDSDNKADFEDITLQDDILKYRDITLGKVFFEIFPPGRYQLWFKSSGIDVFFQTEYYAKINR